MGGVAVSKLTSGVMSLVDCRGSHQPSATSMCTIIFAAATRCWLPCACSPRPHALGLYPARLSGTITETP